MIKRKDLNLMSSQLIKDLEPLTLGEINDIRDKYPLIPKDYLDFLKNFGPGKVREVGLPSRFPAHLEYLKEPESAENSYFKDRRIYENGAIGDIIIFGVESNGVAYGFDSEDDFNIVQVDNYRIVEKLGLNFQEFFFGVLACFPDFPKRFSLGIWYNDIDEEFGISSLL